MTHENDKWFRIAQLLARQRVGQLSEEEFRELEEWRGISSENELLYKRWQSDEFLETGFRTYQGIDYQKALSDMEKRVHIHYKKGLRRQILYWGSVAAVLVVAVVGGLYLANRGFDEPALEPNMVASMQAQCPVLKLDDGTVISVDSLKGNFEEAGALVSKSGESTLSYSMDDVSQTAVLAYNTIEVPKAAEFQVVLADGTKVWLNSESSLRYPVAFAENERKVYLEGEAYFIVKPGEIPFVVETKVEEIKVFGTEFNVMTYAEEKQRQTTLVKGSIGVRLKGDSVGDYVRLVPGEQFAIDNQSGQVSVKKVDVFSYVAWKDGLFVSHNDDLEIIMMKLSRWYDVEVFYQSTSLKTRKFWGVMKRKDTLEEILEVISKAGKVNFEIRGKTVIVSQ